MSSYSLYNSFDGWLGYQITLNTKGSAVTKLFFICVAPKYAYKVMQTKCGKPDKFKTKILRPILIISICQICEAIVTNSWLRKLKACCLHFVKVKTLTSPIMMKPVHL